MGRRVLLLLVVAAALLGAPVPALAAPAETPAELGQVKEAIDALAEQRSAPDGGQRVVGGRDEPFGGPGAQQPPRATPAPRGGWTRPAASTRPCG